MNLAIFFIGSLALIVGAGELSLKIAGWKGWKR